MDLLKRIAKKIVNFYKANVNILKLPKNPKAEFHSYHYIRHNQRRLEHLASLGLDIAGHTILEVGAGIGDHTSFFINRNCHITTSDARRENVEILHSRYPDITVLQLDLDSPPRVFDKVFDIVYCYGTLYHLKNPAKAIGFMFHCCRGMLLLETCVSFGHDDELHPCNEDVQNPSQSISGIGCRPTRRWVYNQLKKNFEFVYLPITQPNHEEFPIDWTRTPDTTKEILTRAIFIASRKKIDNKLLTEEIPIMQTRH